MIHFLKYYNEFCWEEQTLILSVPIEKKPKEYNRRDRGGNSISLLLPIHLSENVGSIFEQVRYNVVEHHSVEIIVFSLIHVSRPKSSLVSVGCFGTLGYTKLQLSIDSLNCERQIR